MFYMMISTDVIDSTMVRAETDQRHFLLEMCCKMASTIRFPFYIARIRYFRMARLAPLSLHYNRLYGS